MIVKEGQMMLQKWKSITVFFQSGTSDTRSDNYTCVEKLKKVRSTLYFTTVRLVENGAPPNLGNPKV